MKLFAFYLNRGHGFGYSSLNHTVENVNAFLFLLAGVGFSVSGFFLDAKWEEALVMMTSLIAAVLLMLVNVNDLWVIMFVPSRRLEMQREYQKRVIGRARVLGITSLIGSLMLVVASTSGQYDGLLRIGPIVPWPVLALVSFGNFILADETKNDKFGKLRSLAILMSALSCSVSSVADLMVIGGSGTCVQTKEVLGVSLRSLVSGAGGSLMVVAAIFNFFAVHTLQYMDTHDERSRGRKQSSRKSYAEPSSSDEDEEADMSDEYSYGEEDHSEEESDEEDYEPRRRRSRY